MMKNDNSQSQLFIGLLIVVIGIFALVDNLSIFNIHNMFQFWPTIFIAFGLIKLSKSSTPKQRFWGGVFIVIGVVMTLNGMGIIHINVRDWWPLILIVIGIKILLKDKREKNFIDANFSSSSASTSPHVDIVAVFGGSDTSVTTQDFRGGSITAILGGVELDLRQAVIQDYAVLDVVAVTGGVVLKIPRDWVVENQVAAVLGGMQDKTVPILGSQKRLILTGSAVMGGIEIKN